MRAGRGKWQGKRNGQAGGDGQAGDILVSRWMGLGRCGGGGSGAEGSVGGVDDLTQTPSEFFDHGRFRLQFHLLSMGRMRRRRSILDFTTGG